MSTAIAISGVSKRFAEIQALDNISFDICQGEFFGLLGANGAGKSTLINIIAGLVRATTGSVKVLSYDVVKQYRQARQRLGVVPQELVYDPFFNVREVLQLQAGYFACGKANYRWIDELLELLDLTEKAKENLYALSGGMKRRVLIAQALVHKPDIVVLDEPTAGVDVELRKSLWQMTNQLHQQGMTIVLTTHYLEEAEALCDRIAILSHGKLKILDAKHQLLDRYPYRWLCLYFHQKFVVPDALQAKVVTQTEQQLTLKLHKQQDSIGEILEYFHQQGLILQDLQMKEPSLQDVFLELTQEAS